ncbi:MAG: TnpV protein [Acetanaerobacterium sp.]
MSNLTYTEDNGVMYPNLTIDSVISQLGNYGLTAHKYLLENKFNLFQEWLFTGHLGRFLLKLDQRYQRLSAAVTETLKQSEPFTDSGDFREKAQYLYRIQRKAKELVMAQLIEELDAL